MIGLTVETNASQVARNWGLIGGKLSGATQAANWQVGNFMIMQAQKYAPVKGGFLRKSIHRGKTKTTKGLSSIEVVADAPHAIFQEYGTKPSRIFGFYRRRGKGRYGEGYNIPLFSRRGILPSYPHPGVRARWFMTRARGYTEKEAPKIIERRIGEVFLKYMGG